MHLDDHCIFPPRTRADVAMVQCVSEGHSKPDDFSLLLRLFRQVVCHALQRHTAPSLHLPLFLEENFYTPLFFDFFYGKQIAYGQWLGYLKGFQTTVVMKECAPNAWQGV